MGKIKNLIIKDMQLVDSGERIGGNGYCKLYRDGRMIDIPNYERQCLTCVKVIDEHTKNIIDYVYRSLIIKKVVDNKEILKIEMRPNDIVDIINYYNFGINYMKHCIPDENKNLIFGTEDNTVVVLAEEAVKMVAQYKRIFDPTLVDIVGEHNER